MTSSRIQLVDKREHPLLMRHCDEHPGEIAHRSCTGDEGRQVIWFDPERNANCVGALFDKQPVQQLWRLRRAQRVAYQTAEPRSA
ncbi:hypothetical protein ADM96_16255 [Burkholderia sp. ST111]|nr:hypothetical protein ADM96_16255 [Burkholderia sp. ST111]